MKKFEIIFGTVVLVMLMTIIALCYKIGANTTVLWCLLVPMVIIRFIRAILLIRTK